jgi:hypothetical protein
MSNNSNTRPIQVLIYDPPMCCPSGLCGPAVDPALLAIHEASLKLRREFKSKIHFERYVLSQQGPKFMENPDIMNLLKTNGVEVLPVTVINGQIMKKQSYPSYDELKNFIDSLPIVDVQEEK